MIADNEWLKKLEGYAGEPAIKCKGGIHISRVCTNSKCTNPALFCNSDDCSSCQLLHDHCSSVRLTAFTKLLKQRLTSQRDFVTRIFAIQDQAIRSLKTGRQQLIQSLHLKDIEERYTAELDAIYQNGQSVGINGREAYEIHMRMLEHMVDKQTGGASLERNYDFECNRIIDELYSIRQSIFSSYSQKLFQKQNAIFGKTAPVARSQIEAPKPNQLQKVPTLSTSVVPPPITFPSSSAPIISQPPVTNSFRLDSKIISPKDLASLQFIRKALREPRQLRPLFRASVYNYSAYKFHQKCNNIPNTFTLIQTEHGNKIGAFTPNQWSNKDDLLVHDKQSLTTLFSIDSKVQLSLTNPYMATYNKSNLGPCFGGVDDLFISDMCHTNSCRGKICTNFTSKDRKFPNNQQIITTFTGVKSGWLFKITEYEVFQVIY